VQLCRQLLPSICSVGLCGWKCSSKSSEECRESIFKEVLGKMESRPYWSLV